MGISEQRARDVLHEYESALKGAPLAAQSRRAYRSRVAGYLGWLVRINVGPGDPLTDPLSRDYAVGAYQAWLKTARDTKPATVNAIRTALDHFYDHLRLGAAMAGREERPAAGPRVLADAEQRGFLRAVERASIRDRAIAYTLFFTGIRVAELVALDLEHVRMRGHKRLIVWEGKGRGYREIPLETEPRPVLKDWIAERGEWPGVDRTPACFVNRRGGRLTTRSVDDLVVRIGRESGVGPDEPVTPHVLRHTYGARLLREGTDIARVSELMGHKRLETTRRYLATLGS